MLKRKNKKHVCLERKMKYAKKKQCVLIKKNDNTVVVNTIRTWQTLCITEEELKDRFGDAEISMIKLKHALGDFY